MSSLRENVSQILFSGNSQEIDNHLIEKFRSNQTGIFQEEECVLWDYKESFPHSRSDDYCGGIVRLICGLHNVYGGIIIFGVNDKTRKPGKNKVKIDTESFNTFLREKLTAPIECKLVSLDLHEPNEGGGRYPFCSATVAKQTTYQVHKGHRKISIRYYLHPKKPRSTSS